MSNTHRSVTKWWAGLAFATAATLLIVWLARVAGVQLNTLLSIVAGGAGLAWAVVLVAVPWNLYFAARGVTAEMAVSDERGIPVREAHRDEARRIERWMLRFALGGHVVTALAIGLVTYFSGHVIGYYFTGFYLLSALVRPAAAYFAHLRERITALTREASYPRDDVVTLQTKVVELSQAVERLTDDVPKLRGAVGQRVERLEARLSEEIAHSAKMLVADTTRLQATAAADREAAISRNAELGRKVDRMIRQFEATLDGFSDHQELQVGLRALIRMIKTDAA